MIVTVPPGGLHLAALSRTLTTARSRLDPSAVRYHGSVWVGDVVASARDPGGGAVGHFGHRHVAGDGGRRVSNSRRRRRAPRALRHTHRHQHRHRRQTDRSNSLPELQLHHSCLPQPVKRGPTYTPARNLKWTARRWQTPTQQNTHTVQALASPQQPATRKPQPRAAAKNLTGSQIQLQPAAEKQPSTPRDHRTTLTRSAAHMCNAMSDANLTMGGYPTRTYPTPYTDTRAPTQLRTNAIQTPNPRATATPSPPAT